MYQQAFQDWRDHNCIETDKTESLPEKKTKTIKFTGTEDPREHNSTLLVSHKGEVRSYEIVRMNLDSDKIHTKFDYGNNFWYKVNDCSFF